MTPALLLDIGAARRNIATMAEAASAHGIGLRPHVKAHKCAQLARLQLDAGALGPTCATTAEALLCAAVDASPILLANQLLDKHALDLLAATEADVVVAVDSLLGVERLDAAAAAAGRTLGAAVEIDVGMGRAGARDDEEAAALARAIDCARHVELRGFQGYEGHCMSIADRAERLDAMARAHERLVAMAGRVTRDEGLFVSAGGTGTLALETLTDGITDIQPGSYVLMGTFHEQLVPGRFESACVVRATMTSLHGRRAILDAGRKSLSVEFSAPRVVGFDASVVSVAEEHMLLEFHGPLPELGSQLDVVPSYVPTTVVLHDRFVVVDDGVSVGSWPIVRSRRS